MNVVLYNLRGEVVAQKLYKNQIGFFHSELIVQDLPPGLYSLTIVTGNDINLTINF